MFSLPLILDYVVIISQEKSLENLPMCTFRQSSSIYHSASGNGVKIIDGHSRCLNKFHCIKYFENNKGVPGPK